MRAHRLLLSCARAAAAGVGLSLLAAAGPALTGAADAGGPAPVAASSSPATPSVPAPVTESSGPVWYDPIPNPPASEPPNPDFYPTCQQYGDTSTQCVAATLSAIDHARAAEGVGAMRLPANYGSLSPAEQMFVVVQAERAARGLPALAGINSYLNTVAQTGADDNADPYLSGSVPGTTVSGGWDSNWAQDYGALGSDYDWMYNDGPGSGNLDCTATNTAGCWGHRENILAKLPAPEMIFGGASAGTSSYALILAGVSGAPALYQPPAPAAAAPDPVVDGMRFSVPNGHGPVLVTTSGGTSSIGGTVLGGVSATAIGATTVIAVRGGNSQVFVRGVTFGRWGAWTDAGGITVATPAIATAPTGQVGVFVRGRNNQLYLRGWWHGRWYPWVSMGGSLTGGVWASATATGIQVSVVGPHGATYSRTFLDGRGWTGWYRD